MMTAHYAATAVKDGEWWLIEIPEIGAYGQAVSLASAPAVAREVTALWLDVDPSDVEVTVTARPDPETVSAIARADELAAQAAALAAQAAELRATAVREYVARRHLTRREAAATLDISMQRVQQLVSS